MISSIEWVPEGVADPQPKKYELSTTEQELIELMEKQTMNDNDVNGGVVDDNGEVGKDKEKKSKINLPKIENTLPADLRMDEYSSDEDDENNAAVQGSAIGTLLVEDNTTGPNIIENDDDDDDNNNNQEEDDKDGMDSNNDDDDDSDSDDDLADVPDTREFTPIDVEGLQAMGLSQAGGSNVPMHMEFPENGEEDDDSEADDVRLAPDDAIVVVAKTEEDFASLEVLVYEQKTGNLFVHHDILLPAFPLCLAHGDIDHTGSAGNFCAVGTFNPGIEVWNLDVLNALEPACILGGDDTTMADELMRNKIIDHSNNSNTNNKKKKKKNKKKQQQQHQNIPDGPRLRPGSHTDAIMSLSWNKVHRQVLASGSADCTVKLWDITQANNSDSGGNASTFNHHRDKVQSVVWHPTEGTLLATGSYDRTVALVDARSNPNEQEHIKRVKIPADCEAIAWDPFRTENLTVASEDGTIMCWDVRKFSTSTPLWSMVANEYGGVSDLSYSPHVPGMLATCAIDKTVTLWDSHHDKSPRVCGNKDMGVGKLYTVNFYPSSPWLLGCAGGGKELALWNMSREVTIQKVFGNRGHTPPIPLDNNENDDNNNDNNNGSSIKKQEDFDAMMSSTDKSKDDEMMKSKKAKLNKKKKDKQKKRKAHKAGNR